MLKKKFRLKVQQLQFVFFLLPLLLLIFNCGEDKLELGIEGKVLGEFGQPIPAATVKIDGPESQSVVTDTDGRFFFGDILAGTYQISVIKDKHKGYNSTIRVIDKIATSDVILEKEDSQTISGVVLNSENNQPIANVQLTTIPVTYAVTTDNNGNYQFGQKLDPGNYALTAVVEGYETAKVDISVQAGEPARADVKMNPLKPVLGLSADRLDFGSGRNSMELIIKNSGTGTLTWKVSAPSEPWIKLEKFSGTSTKDSPATLEIEVDREGLEAEPHQLKLAVTSNGGIKEVMVIIDVDPNPLISVSPAELNFGLEKETLEFTISNKGTGGLEWKMTTAEGWATADNIGGVTRKVPTGIKITVNRENRDPGNYDQIISILSNGGTTKVTVMMEVPEKPKLETSRTAFDFGSQGDSLDLIIRNVGTGELSWKISVPTQAWLEISRRDGIATANKSSNVNFSLDRRGVGPGKHNQTLTIQSNGGDQKIEVSMIVDKPKLIADSHRVSFDPVTNEQALTLKREGFSIIDFEILPSKNWVLVKPQSGKLGDDPLEVQVQVDRQNLPQGESQAVLRIQSNQASEILEITIKVLVLPTFRLLVKDARTDRPVKGARALDEETALDGTIEIKDLDLAVISGKIEIGGYMDRGFQVRLNDGVDQVVEHVVHLTPIPRKVGAIESPQLDLPIEISAASDGALVYVTNNFSASISQIQTDANRIIKTLDLARDGKEPMGIDIHPLTGEIYVANSFVEPAKVGGVQNDSVSIIPEAFNKSTAVTVGNRPVAVAVDSVTNQLYVANYDSKTISILNLGNRQEVGVVALQSSPSRMAIVGADLYVVTENSIAVVDLRLRRVIKNIRNVVNPADVVASTDQRFAYVVNSGNDNLLVVDTKSRTIVQKIQVGVFPIRLAIRKGFRGKGDMIYVVNQGNSTISIIEQIGTDWKVAEEEIKVGFNPRGIVAIPGKVYVVLQEDSIIEVLGFE